MRLLLVRHAKAFERDAAAWPDDTRRPLTAAGRAAFVRFAKRLRSSMLRVDAVVASPAVRAWQTARLLHEHADWPEPERCTALAPDADELDALRPVDVMPQATLDAEDATVAWVGHEPSLSRSASWLLTGHPTRLAIDLKKGAVLALDLPGSARELEGGSGRLLWLVTPRFARRQRGR